MTYYYLLLLHAVSGWWPVLEHKLKTRHRQRDNVSNGVYVRSTLNIDCETFRISPLLSKRTIRVPDEGGCRWRRDLRLQRCNRVAVGQKFNTDWSGKNAESTSWTVSSKRKWCATLQLLNFKVHRHPSARDKLYESSQPYWANSASHPSGVAKSSTRLIWLG